MITTKLRGLKQLRPLNAMFNASTQPAAEKATRMRRRRMTPERWEELQAALDRDGGPTEAEAEEVLQHFGTSGKEVTNQFIERLMRENLELRAKSAGVEALETTMRAMLAEAEFVGDAKAPFSTWVAEKCRAALAQLEQLRKGEQK